ncbi:MAG: hypothetical protein LBK95_11885 [Bifidobacteriaceae bacterium]|jgi:hypothetical protein|nr:hypothetical protein [Bifidobacteriaceae bacterium]
MSDKNSETGNSRRFELPDVKMAPWTFTKLGVIAVAVAFALAAWRNMPPLPGASGKAAGAGIAVAVLVAFLLGRRSVKAEAVATAVASARAQALAAARAHAEAKSVAAVQVNIGEGARAVAAREIDSPSWVAGRVVGAEEVAEQLEGSDASESLIDDGGGMRELEAVPVEAEA